MKNGSNRQGFSLVEVLVAAAVITLSLFSVVAFVRKGQEMITIQKHRAIARGWVEQRLEQPPYQPEYYNTLTTTTLPAPIVNVTIDAKMTPNIIGTGSVVVGDIVTTVNGVNAPYRPVTATVFWSEPGGKKDTVTISKWLANVQRD